MFRVYATSAGAVLYSPWASRPQLGQKEVRIRGESVSWAGEQIGFGQGLKLVCKGMMKSMTGGQCSPNARPGVITPVPRAMGWVT